jgi:hypothetical protein
MRDVRSRYGRVWLDAGPTAIDAVAVTETSMDTVQIGISITCQADRNHSLVRDELLLELDPLAAAELAEKLAAAALNITKNAAVAALHTPN